MRTWRHVDHQHVERRLAALLLRLLGNIKQRLLIEALHHRLLVFRARVGDAARQHGQCVVVGGLRLDGRWHD